MSSQTIDKQTNALNGTAAGNAPAAVSADETTTGKESMIPLPTTCCGGYSLSETLADIENCPLGSVAAAHATASSELNSYEAIPLENLTDDQISRIAVDAEFSMLHLRSKEIGAQVMKFVRFFERYKPIVVAMKAKFGPRRGSHHRIEVEPGVMVTWAEYCERYYGVSYRWVEKLLDGDYVVVPNEDGAEAAHSANRELSATDDPPTIIEKKASKKDRMITQLQKQVDELDLKLKSAEAAADQERDKIAKAVHTPRALWKELNESTVWIDALDNVFMVESEQDFASRLSEFAQYIADAFQKGFTVEVRCNREEEGGE